MFVYQLVKIKKILDEVSNYEGAEFAFAVFKNKQLIDKKLKSVDFIRSVSPDVIEYENKRVDLCEQYGKRDENGELIINDELYVIDNVEEFKIKMEELNNIYGDSVNERQKQIEIFNSCLIEHSIKCKEILLVENGSSDNTWKIIKKLENKNKLIRGLQIKGASYGRAVRHGLLSANAD